MAIPKYILKEAQDYCAKNGGDAKLLDAFIAGFLATRQPKSRSIPMTDKEEERFCECWESYNKKGRII